MANSKELTDQQAALISISSTETMDLIGVNNSIVNMRKTVMKARIHVIRQLLRQTKELQRKKSKTDAQKAQNERKTSRLQSEVTIIKQLKKDEMAKFALTNKKKFIPEINPEKDADRMDKLLKQRALVRLANTSVLKKDVEAFRTKYPTWENDLVKILKVLGKKQQKKDELAKKKKRSEVKSKKKAEKLPKSDPKNEDKSDSENGEPKVNEADIENESDSVQTMKQT